MSNGTGRWIDACLHDMARKALNEGKLLSYMAYAQRATDPYFERKAQAILQYEIERASKEDTNADE